MKNSNITVRVDSELKREAEKACDFLGLTVTSVVHQALYKVIHQSEVMAELLERAQSAQTRGVSGIFNLTYEDRKALFDWLSIGMKK